MNKNKNNISFKDRTTGEKVIFILQWIFAVIAVVMLFVKPSTNVKLNNAIIEGIAGLVLILEAIFQRKHNLSNMKLIICCALVLIVFAVINFVR